MKEPLSYAPTLPAAIGIVTGVLLSGEHFIFMVVAAVIAAIVLFRLKRHWWAAVCLFLAIGVLDFQIQKPNDLAPEYFDNKSTFSARIDRVSITEQTTQCVLTLDSINSCRIPPVGCQLTIFSVEPDLEKGERIGFEGILKSVDTPPLLPGMPDYRGYFKANGIVCKCACGPTEIFHIANPGRVQTTFNHIYDSMNEAIARLGVSDACSTFLSAVILGDDSLISPHTRECFRATGISHILALSGLHVGIIVAIAMMLTLPLNIWRKGLYFRWMLAVFFVWGYAFLVGMQPSVVRAALMISILMLARLVQRGHTGINSLLLSIIAVLVMRPMWLYSIGFQLTVGAVVGILCVMSMVPQKLRRSPVKFTILSYFLIPIAAMIGTGPISAYHFGMFPVYFLPGNIVAGLLVPWILTGGVIVMLFSLMHYRLIALCWVTDKLFALLMLCTDWIASWPGAIATGITFTAWAIVPYSLALLSLWWGVRSGVKIWYATSFCCLALSILLIPICKDTKPAAELHIVYDKKATTVVMRSGERALAYSDRQTKDLDDRYRGFLDYCGAEEFKQADGEILEGPFYINGNTIVAGNQMIMIIADDVQALRVTGKQPNYLLLCNGFKGDPVAVADILKPDTILLSSDMNARRARRYVSECEGHYPVRDLSHERFSIVFR